MTEQNNLKIIPDRLKEARMARGLSVIELSKVLNVTRQAIFKYENGGMLPSQDVLKKYVDILEFPIRFYITPVENFGHTESKILFRSLLKSTDGARGKLEVRAKWMGRVFRLLEDYLDFPAVRIKRQGFSEEYDDYEIEEIAKNIRLQLGLGEGPISNLDTVLENNGVLISRMSVKVDNTDACSQWQGDRPFIFLTSDKNSAVRSRFDLAHELGHFILHDVDNTEELNKKRFMQMESEAHRFASAFLMPAGSFSQEVMSTSISYFIELKKRWKVSVAAMIYRCKDLEILSESQISYLWRQLTAKGYRRHEPLDDIIEYEEPFMLRSAVELLDEHKILKPISIQNYLELPPDELGAICNLPANLFEDKPVQSRAKLRLV